MFIMFFMLYVIDHFFTTFPIWSINKLKKVKVFVRFVFPPLVILFSPSFSWQGRTARFAFIIRRGGGGLDLHFHFLGSKRRKNQQAIRDELEGWRLVRAMAPHLFMAQQFNVIQFRDKSGEILIILSSMTVSRPKKLTFLAPLSYDLPPGRPL